MSNDINFDEFISKLSIGIEMEFTYKNKLYSFNYWDEAEYTCNNLLIYKSADRREFIDYVKKLYIDGVSLENIMNNHLYCDLM